jgi:hypothetical protein
MEEMHMIIRVFVVSMLLATLALSTVAVSAQGAAQVYLTSVASSSDAVTVEVMADNVTDLYGMEFLLNFDPAIVSVLDANPQQEGIQVKAGTLLPESQGFVVINQADTDTGKIAFAMTLLNPAPAVSGSGSLARITFNIKQPTASQVNIEDVKLVSIDLQIIPVETTGLTIGDAAPNSPAFPWWIPALIIIVLGLAALGILIFAANNDHVQNALKRT